MRTWGHEAASAAIRKMVEGRRPHALLLVGPPSVGKTTLAVDLAAGLLCQAAQATDGGRPCRSCRACRMVESGNHPDLHRIAPDGPGGQIRIDSVRRLASELALLPVEGGARVAIVEAAHRLNDDAQNALLKTLEEPPSGVTIVLCADDEDRLLPTVRSRCARLRLGPVDTRSIEGLLAERGLGDASLGARVARLAGGRPGLAIAYAAAPEAVTIRAEIARTLVDLLDAGRTARLAAIRGLVARAGDLVVALAGAPPAAPSRSEPGGVGTDGAGTDGEAAPEAASAKVPAAERRRAALALLAIAGDLVHDLALAASGDLRGLRDPGLIDDLGAVAARLPAGAAAAALADVARTGELIEANVAPELALDVLVLRWPRLHGADAA